MEMISFTHIGRTAAMLLMALLWSPQTQAETTFKYQILDETAKTIYLYEPDGFGETLEFPETYSVGGTDYTVTKVAASGQTGLKTLRLPKTLRELPDYAFAGDYSLTDVYLPVNNATLLSSVEAFPASAFSYEVSNWVSSSNYYRQIYNQATLHLKFGLTEQIGYSSCWAFFATKAGDAGNMTLLAPEFSKVDEEFDDQFYLTLTNPNATGTIYYFMRYSEDETVKTYTEPILIRKGSLINAIVMDDEGNVSPVVEKSYRMANPYQIYVDNGVYVTEANCNDVLHDGGSVRYDHTTKTLYLNGANIDEINARCSTPEFRFIIEGNNTVRGGINVAFDLGESTDIPTTVLEGTGTLNITNDDKSGNGGNLTAMRSNLVVIGITLNCFSISPKYGGGELTISNAMVTADCSKDGFNGCITGFTKMTLGEGISVVEPLGAQFFCPTNLEHLVEAGSNFFTADADLAGLDNALNANDYSYMESFRTQYMVKRIVIAPVTTLDENNAYTALTVRPFYLQLNHAMNAGWNSICLPVGVTVADAFSSEAKAYAFTGYHDGALSLEVTDQLLPGQPYLLYTPNAITEPLLMACQGDLVNEAATVTFNGAKFIGTYDPIAAPALDGKFGITPDGIIGKGSATASILGFRAYFDLPAADASRLRLVIGGASGITTIDAFDANSSNFYNLNGQHVGTPAHRGIYVTGGRKVVVR